MLKTIKLLDLPPGDNNNEVIGGGRDRNPSKSKRSKNAKSGIQTYIKTTGEPMFPTFGAREAFNQLR